MNYLLLLLIICSGFQYVCAVESAIGKSFEGFVQEYVPQTDQKKFCTYYNKLMQELKTIIGPEKKAYLDSIRHIASASIEINNPRLFEEIELYTYRTNPLVKHYDPAKTKEIKKFLFRYGALEKYKKEQLLAQTRPWNKVQSFIKNIGNSVSCWFNSIKMNPFA